MSQTKYKWMVFLVLVLLTSNMVLAFFLFFSNDKKEKNRDNQEERAMAIYKEIGLDSNQIVVFKKEKDDYFNSMRPIWNENRKTKDSLYKKLELNSSDRNVQLLLDQMSDLDQYSDSFTFAHFSKLRELLTIEQQTRFDTIIPKLVNRPRGRR
jgi:predicted RND superfamily exporter protein